MFFKGYPNLTRFKPYFRRRAPLIAALVFCMLTASSMGVLLSYLMSRQLIAISGEILPEMVKFTLIILATVLIHHVTWYFWGRLDALIGSAVASDIRRDIIESALGESYLGVLGRSSGYYLERLGDDTGEVSEFLQNVTGTLVDVLTNLAFLVIVMIQNWQCGLVFSAGLIALYLLDLVKISVEMKHTRRLKPISEEMNGRAAEAIRGIKDVKTLGIRREIARRYALASEKYAEGSARMKSEVTFWERVRTFTQWLIDSALVLMCAVWLFPKGETTAVIILIIFNYKGLVYDTVGYFSKMKGYYVQGEFKAGRILEIIDRAGDDFGGVRAEAGPARVEVRNLSCAYGGVQVLKNVSLTLEPGTVSLVTGVSGAGKSTLFSYISRLNAAPAGTVYINGVDINDYDEESVSRIVGAVSQEPFFFDDTVMGNLRMVKPGASDEEIFAACRKAGVYGEISRFPDGFQTRVTENGASLSGGQRRRLAIARALLKNAPVMLLDEPTGALDAENQAAVMRLISEIKPGRTIFVISHDRVELSAFDGAYEIAGGTLVKVK